MKYKDIKAKIINEKKRLKDPNEILISVYNIYDEMKLPHQYTKINKGEKYENELINQATKLLAKIYNEYKDEASDDITLLYKIANIIE